MPRQREPSVSVEVITDNRPFVFVFGQYLRRPFDHAPPEPGAPAKEATPPRPRRRRKKRKFDQVRYNFAVRQAERSRAAAVGSWRELGKKRKKRAIEPVAASEEECKKLFGSKFQRWLEYRELDGCLKRDPTQDPPASLGKPQRPFMYFKYRPRRSPDNARVQPGPSWERAYHGTWFYGLRGILHHGVLLESVDEDAGHEFWRPGLYLTQNLCTANWYARAQRVFNDAMFHRAIVEVAWFFMSIEQK